MAEIDVAVIIVTYKTAQLTIDCLRSIDSERAMAGVRVRCVVVDNHSGDAPEIAAAIASGGWGAWAKLVIAERNGGFAYGNNIGIRQAYADGLPDYLHFLNPDTVLRPGAIEELVRFLEANPATGIAGGSFENADTTEWATAFRFPSLVAEFVQGLGFGLVAQLFSRWEVPMAMGHDAESVDWVLGASMMVRRQVIESIGGMDEGFFLYYEETEFCFRAKAAGYSIWYVPQSRVMHIAGQSTKVMERNVAPRRLPGYWFESRRRYFIRTGGLAYAIAADLVAVVAHVLGGLKRLLQGRTPSEVPHFIGDMMSKSLIWPRNRRAEPNSSGAPHF